MMPLTYQPTACDPDAWPMGPNWFDRDRRDPEVRRLEREGLDALLREVEERERKSAVGQ